MARIRSIKPELRTSLTVAEWPRDVRYFWVLLWGYLDDEGYGVDEPRLIKADCFPLDDDLTSADIDKWLDVIAASGAVCRYAVGERRYLHAPKWGDHQKPQHPKESRLPPCPHEDCGSASRSSHEAVSKPHEVLTPEQGAGSREQGAGRGNARARDALTADKLLTEHLGKLSHRPPKDVLQETGSQIDRLLADKTEPDVIREALARWRGKGKYPPSLLPKLVADIQAEAAKPGSRASPRGHQPYRNPEDDSAYEGKL